MTGKDTNVHSGPSGPWERRDRYGECGLTPQPLVERLRLMVMALCVAPLKLLGAACCLLSFFTVTKIAKYIFPKEKRTDWVAALGKMHCRMCLFFIGFVSVTWIGAEVEENKRKHRLNGKKEGINVGIVSNHTSWCDILVHMSHYFPSFVARQATETSPIVGSISKSMGCIYVDRTKVNGNGVGSKVKDRMKRLAQGNPQHERPILLFPEATTTNGKFLLPFRSGAFLAGEPLRPVILKYDTRGVSPAWESIAAHWHAFLMLCNLTHHVTCYELPIYMPSPEERQDPVLYASNVRQYMVSLV